VVESADAAALFREPRHPYTQALISAVPEPDPDNRRTRIVLSGEPPNPESPPSGCAFHPRCPQAMSRCKTEAPAAREIGAGPHLVNCHLY
jgi:oligopeptide transport system ATP-binding protein